MTKELCRVFPDTPPYEGAFLDLIQHIAIAKGMLIEMTKLKQVIFKTLKLPIRVLVNEMVVMEETEDGQWGNRCVISLEDSV